MKIKGLFLIGFVCTGFVAFSQQKTAAQKADSVIRLMTLEEKVGQLNQYSGRNLTGPGSEKNTDKLADIKKGLVGSMLNVKGVAETREIQAAALHSRLKIPLLFSLDVIHGYKTVFPVPLGEAASWDLNIIQQSAHIAAKEAAASGIHWTFAPMVDVGRDPRWGRVMEGAGEDAYLGSKIAAARVRGFQGEKLGGTDAIMACAKHFVGYGAAIGGRDYNAVDMSLQQLWEVYLPPFKAAVDASVATFMNSFNTLNGIPATGNAYLQRNILKGTWKYNGFVVSDWGSIGEMVPHGFAANDEEAALKAIIAGSDMDMESKAYKGSLAKLVKDKKVSMALIDDAVKRILIKKFELGLFDDPYKFSDVAREMAVMNDPSHKLIARAVAQKSIVLLKNKGQLLPLRKDLKLALIGPLAKSKRDLEGDWIVKSDTNNVVSVYEGLIAKGSSIQYSKGCDIKGVSEEGFAEALKVAAAADVIILAIGESHDMTGEAKSKTDISIPGKQQQLFNQLKTLGKPIVVLMMAGRPLIMNTIADSADAILYTWFGGSEAGNAIANVVFGEYNPSGKLPISFPRNVGQIPISHQQYNTGRPITDPKNITYKSAYLDAPNSPLYAFGFGMSYSSFVYSDLKLSSEKMNVNNKITVSFTISNNSKIDGEEVVQLYLRDHVASVVRPIKELKGFQKLSINAGTSKQVQFEIDKNSLSFFNNDLKWVAEPGTFSIMIGAASDDIRLQSEITLTK